MATTNTAELLLLADECHGAAIVSTPRTSRAAMGRYDWQEAFRAQAIARGIENKTWQMGFVVGKCLSLSGYGG